MSDYDPNAKHVDIKASVQAKASTRVGKTKRNKGGGKKFAIEFYIREYGGTQPPEHPLNEDFVCGMDAGAFALHKDTMLKMALHLLGQALDARFDGDYSAYPELEEAMRVAQSGLVRPTQAPLTEQERKIMSNPKRSHE